MPSADVRPAPYVPRRFASGTFPVSRNYNLRQMLYNYAYPKPRDDNSSRDPSDQVIPSFPFSDVPVYADSVDIETLAFHRVWGCLLTPENVAGGIYTDDLRYHVWVAAKRVIESGRVNLADKGALLRAAMDQFVVELGLVLLDLCSGPLVLFLDPRLHSDANEMVSRATALVAKFDDAQVRRWRIIITVPATEEGLCAASVLGKRHGIQTHLALVSCLAHAAACVDAGAGMVSMSVTSIMEWFEQQHDVRAGRISQDHPGIEAIQSCATFIHRRGINTTLLTTDVRKWAELKQLGGIGATSLTKDQLDQIPMRRLTTWYPRPDDQSAATLQALEVPYPTHADHKGFLASLPAETRSLVSAVLYVRLSKMKAQMETIESVVRYEIERRIRLETIPLEYLYQRPNTPDEGANEARSTHRSASSRSRSRSRREARRRQHEAPEPNQAAHERSVEGIDYF